MIVAIILVWYFFLRKKKAESGFDEFGSPNDPFGDENQGTPESNFVLPRLGIRRKSSGLTAMTSSNPLTDCIKRCQAQGFPYEKCLSDCSESGPSTPPAITL